MVTDPKNVRALFLKIAALPPDEHSEAVRRECGHDGELRRELESLLDTRKDSDAGENSDSRLDATMDSGPVESGSDATQEFGTKQPQSSTALYSDTDLPGTTLADRYELESKIGEGGMGEVWLAKQTEPVRRKVAIKLIKKGMDSKSVLQRFEQERQALAMMDHPHIARVLDGGVTPSGQPFFAMEYVTGLPLTKFCDKERLNPKERLELFIPICQAVQHAHQKAVVHRDLKPANILVSMIDDRPVPKVIDFGVAKALGGKLTQESMDTQIGSVVGTLEYMPPEQAGMSSGDIDTRADIYSLGVVLYELLTGLRPIDAQRLKPAGLSELVRVIQEEEPSKPSTRLSTADLLPSLAAVRSTEPKKLSAMLRGELDWIVMKCLEKQRERRYETSDALARDIQRYLSDEPVEARPPTTRYRFSKFLKRNKGPVVAASLVLSALIVGIFGTTYGLFRAEWARRDAVKAQHAEADRAEGERLAKVEARLQTKRALEANEQAQKRLAQTEKSNGILTSIFTTLDPNEIARTDRPLQAILVDKLDDAVKALEGESVGDPLVVASMQDNFGRALLSLGAADKAIVLLEKAHATRESILGLNHSDTHAGMNNLALAYKAIGEQPRAVEILEKTLVLQRTALGDRHADTVTSMSNLAATYQDLGRMGEAVPLFEESLEIRKSTLGPKDPSTLLSMNNLAFGYEAMGRMELALPLYENTLELMKEIHGDDHPATLNTMGNLASCYQEVGNLELALPLLEQTLTLTEETLGPDHPDTLISMASLASGYQDAGDFERALELCQETFKRMKAELGPDHPTTLKSMNNLSVAYQVSGMADKSLPLCKETLSLMREKLGNDHPDTLTSMVNLAAAYQDTGSLDLALPLYEEVLGKQREVLGRDHPDTLKTINNLATAYWSSQQFEKSIPLFEDLVKQSEAILSREHPNTLMTITNLGVNYKDAGRLDEAIPLLEEGYQAGLSYPMLRMIAGPQLVDAYAKVGRDEASTLGLELQAHFRTQFPKNNLQHAAILSQLGLSLLQASFFPAAGDLLQECLTILKATHPDLWLTFSVRSRLGKALMGQKKHAPAETFLIDGYNGLKEREAKLPKQNRASLIEALEYLVQFYEETDDADTAAKWQMELNSQKKKVSP